MDRVAYNAMLAQYATPEVSGNGRVSWDKGVRCVMPSVKLYGKCQQETLTGKNLFNVDWIVEQINAGNFATDGVAYEKTVEIPIENGTYVLSVHNRISDKGTCILSVNKAVNSTSSGAVGLSPTFSDYNAVTVENGALYIGCNSSVENFIYLIQNCMVQIEVGGKLTAYEPYCGGIHAPNPYYPMPIKCNNGVYRATDAAGNYDGGQATAPELYAIPGTEYRDEWDAQTGQGVRRVKKLVLDGTENWKYSKKGDYKICIYAKAYIPALDATYGNAMCSHFSEISYAQATSLTGEIAYKCGIALANTTGYIYMSLPLSLLDTPDLDGAKGYLANQYANGTPVTLFATQDPEPFYIDPARLTMPPGAGQIIQVGGDVADCPITARYLTHS